MKRITTVSVFLLGLFLCAPGVFAEEIDSFQSEIEIRKSGAITVQETITYDFGSRQRHGIIREIPLTKTNTEGTTFRLNFSINSVTDESGSDYHYQKARDNGILKIKIGDPDHTITGVHTYIITYKVEGALTYFDDHDELFWDSTGTEWPGPINQAKTTVTLPDQIKPDRLHARCFTGPEGAREQDCEIEKNSSQVTFSTTQTLASGEGLTVVVGFPTGIVQRLESEPVTHFRDTLIGTIVLRILGVILIVGVLVWYLIYPLWLVYKWFAHGRDPNVGPAATAWYDPPQGNNGRPLTPAETGSLINEVVDFRDLSATIVDLARRGYFTIEEREKNEFYLIKQAAPQDDKLQPFEKTLYEKVFDTDAQEVKIDDLKLYDSFPTLKDQIYTQLIDEGFFPKNPADIRSFYATIMTIALFTFNLPLTIIAATFGRHMARKTLEGSRAAHVARALKNFLTSQQRQLEFQADKQMMFEKLLPYAVAFGVERTWIKRFNEIEIKAPDWYKTTDGTLTAAAFSSSLNRSISSFSSATTAPSSSSGFSSGFSSGGGFSGGGGGGGGGGSW